MRITAFYTLFVLYLLLGLINVVYPVFDRHEAEFVEHLTVAMSEKQQGRDLGWIGPPVETEATVLVTGPLKVNTPPIDISGAVRRDCAVLQYQWKTVGRKSYVYNRGFTVGTSPRIGGYAIDPRFFQGLYAPYETKTFEPRKAGLPCARDLNDCTVDEMCLPVDDYAIIGNLAKDDNGDRLVQLPDASLIDYPLIQKGLYTPATFAEAYKTTMGRRAKETSLFFSAIMFACSILMFATIVAPEANRRFAQRLENTGDDQQRRGFLSGFKIFVQDETDRAALFLALLLPLLPLSAYEKIADTSFFDILLAAYVAGSAYMLYGFNRRFRRTLVGTPTDIETGAQKPPV